MWRACERWGILPPDVKSRRWDDLDNWTQSLLLGYEHVRQHEEAEEFSAMAQARVAL